jgi:hypothetical protein
LAEDAFDDEVEVKRLSSRLCTRELLAVRTDVRASKSNRYEAPEAVVTLKRPVGREFRISCMRRACAAGYRKAAQPGKAVRLLGD